MERLQAYKYELKTNGEQARLLRGFAGSCRFVWNRALALQKQRFEAGEKKLGYAGLCKELTAWRHSPEAGWLMSAPIHPLQQTLKDLERAYRNFFEKRAAFPRFKRKGQKEAFRYPDPKQIRLDAVNCRIFLPKLGWLRYRKSRELLGELRNVTISHSGDRWHISIQTARQVQEPDHPATSMVGVDVGVARFATLSDGSVFAPADSFKKHQCRLARYQRAMARKVKGSSNWRKMKARVARLHQRIGNCRRDHLHKASTAICRDHAVVVIEDLQVRNMSRSAAGSIEQPGRNVRAKSGLNRVILDQGWFEFRRQLEYKLTWAGGDLIAVSPKNTSRTCPVCGHISADNRKTQATFACVQCGHEAHADLVGALNILAAGHAVLACGGAAPSGRPVKQEPTEATTPELAHG